MKEDYKSCFIVLFIALVSKYFLILLKNSNYIILIFIILVSNNVFNINKFYIIINKKLFLYISIGSIILYMKPRDIIEVISRLILNFLCNEI
jgi:hypothetical protein